MKTLNNTSPVRRFGTLIAAGVLTASLVACSDSNGGNSENVSELTVGSSPSLAALSLQGAIANGHFEDNELSVNAVPNKSANDAVPQLLNGGIQVAQMDMLTFFKARSEGLPLKIVAGAGEQSTDGGNEVPSGAGVVVNPDSDISVPVDFVGRKVGVPAIKTQTWMNIRAIVDDAGGDSSQIEFVEVPPAQTIDLVNRGEVEASTPSEPLMSASIAEGKVRLIHSTDVPGLKGVPSSAFVATEDFVNNNPDTVRKFADAIYAAAAEVNGDREAALDIAEKQINLRPEQLEHVFVPALAADHPTSEELQKVIDLAIRYEVLTEAPDTADMVAQADGGN
ncbi:MAG TPA: ABC transporter substrate-binding protein [Brevibacterium sp.]|nr:ABC transporter substrate-binding protein [Brevibacterium sp.]